MKLENYKRTDLEDALDMKRMALHQIEQIEKCIWTDDVDQAAVRAFNLYETMKKLGDMKQAKREEENFSFLLNKLMASGVHASIIHFEHKKTD